MKSFFAMVAVFSVLCAVGMEKIDIANIDENADKTILLSAIRELQTDNAAYVQLNEDIRNFIAEVVASIRDASERQVLEEARTLLNTIADDLENNLPKMQ